MPRFDLDDPGDVAVLCLAAAYEAWATAPDRTFAERAFIQRAGHWARDDATLLSATTTLGLTDDELDALFVQAATL